MIVRCPRCGSMNASSIGAVGIEFDRMHCDDCGYDQVSDHYQIKFEWNVSLEITEVRRGQWYVLPDGRFEELWKTLGAQGSPWPVYAALCAAYEEPHRAYHTARHIGACLRLVDEVEASAEVEAAIWFHDVVYDTGARDNEEKSAELAVSSLTGVDADKLARIASHIRATKSHEADSADGALVLDIDLSILGADEQTFARFEEEIRREYAWVDATAYAAGRSAVLNGFLQRPRIYQTELFRARYEERARANIRWAIGRLANA